MSAEWPEPPADASFEDVMRFANVRFAADFFLAVDEGSNWPAELRLSPAAAWQLAEDTYARLRAGELS